MSLNLLQALTSPGDFRAFRLVEGEELDLERFQEWVVEPVPGEVFEEKDGLFLLRAFQVPESGKEIECFIDLTMPERISDMAYFVTGETVNREYLHECDGEVICAVPINGFGQYDLFYSRTNAELGISVLRHGLERANGKTFIAEDLGYILRDEGRLEEALEAFRISADEDPSTDFINVEIAEICDQLGNPSLAKLYRDRCSSQDQPAPRGPWWKFWEFSHLRMTRLRRGCSFLKIR